MGQKINPIIFRQGITRQETSRWIADHGQFANLQQQDLEIQNFLSSLLRSHGILLRSARISRSSKKLLVELDLYFSTIFAKQSRFFWAKNLFRTIKKKYVALKKMRDLKDFVTEARDNSDSDDSIDFKVPLIVTDKKRIKYKLSRQKRQKSFLKKRKKNFVFNTSVLTYKDRFFFFLLKKKVRTETFVKKENFSILGGVKHSSQSALLRVKFGKLKKLFRSKKLKYNFQNYHLKSSFVSTKKDKKSLLVLTKALSQSLQNYTGYEDIHLRIYSSQLNFLPTFKYYKRSLEKDLRYLQRSKDLKNYFSETLQVLYFTIGSFGCGNAALLGKFISYMIETNRRHTSITRFLKKSLQVFFKNLPSNCFAIEGIRIMIKGRFNKRRRTKTITLREGEISLQTLKMPVDYHQNQAITLYGSFGIKVWIAKKVEKTI